MRYEAVGRTLFASIAVWFIVVSAQLVRVDMQADTVASHQAQTATTVG